jgi:hypothetical protein
MGRCEKAYEIKGGSGVAYNLRMLSARGDLTAGLVERGFDRSPFSRWNDNRAGELWSTAGFVKSRWSRSLCQKKVAGCAGVESLSDVPSAHLSGRRVCFVSFACVADAFPVRRTDFFVSHLHAEALQLVAERVPQELASAESEAATLFVDFLGQRWRNPYDNKLEGLWLLLVGHDRIS